MAFSSDSKSGWGTKVTRNAVMRAVLIWVTEDLEERGQDSLLVQPPGGGGLRASARLRQGRMTGVTFVPKNGINVRELSAQRAGAEAMDRMLYLRYS